MLYLSEVSLLSLFFSPQFYKMRLGWFILCVSLKESENAQGLWLNIICGCICEIFLDEISI